MSVVGQSPETVSKKKRDFFLMGECFFLTYFPIGACLLFFFGMTESGFLRSECGMTV